MQSDSEYVNIAAYKFITFDDTAAKRPEFLAFCNAQQLKGTILLSPEGINLFLAGKRAGIDAFLEWLRADPRFTDIPVKESYSVKQPFNRMLVKLKARNHHDETSADPPELGRAPSVEPKTLKRWLDQGHDDAGKPVVMVDTRNAFEVDVGTFDDTIDYRIEKFSEFPEVIEANKDALAGKTIVTFCTGGIRCEKAAIHMQQRRLRQRVSARRRHSEVFRGCRRRALRWRMLCLRLSHLAQPGIAGNRHHAMLQLPPCGHAA